MGFVPCVMPSSVGSSLSRPLEEHASVLYQSILAFALVLVVVAADFETIDMHIME